jgi:three-Cys-motif partner protein
MKKDVKTNLLGHSQAKVRLLGEYLKRYLNIISNDGYTEKIHIHDLFCGPGEFEDGGEGSPIVALRHVKETHYTKISRKPIPIPKIDCHFNDIATEKIVSLKAAISSKSLHYSTIGELNFTSNDYANEVLELKAKLKRLKNEKGFIFIDPYGYKEIKADHIKGLMDNDKAEVLLWLPTQFMYRFSKNGTPEALLSFIEELTDYKEWKKNDSVWKFINQLKDGFQSYLGSKYYVDNFSLQKDENTVFCLYFFTSHIKGFEKMLEAKWEIDTDQGRGWKYTDNDTSQMSLFVETQTNDFEEKLRIYLGEKRFNYEVFEFTLRQGYLPKHANQILQQWQKNENLTVNLANGEKARKNSFYLKYLKPSDPDKKKVYFILK